MLPAILLSSIVGFFMGWIFKDYRWANAAKKGKIMVVDGDMYKVTQYTDTHGGTVEK
jgi:hypothetical protein